MPQGSSKGAAITLCVAAVRGLLIGCWLAVPKLFGFAVRRWGLEVLRVPTCQVVSGRCWMTISYWRKARRIPTIRVVNGRFARGFLAAAAVKNSGFSCRGGADRSA